jgi:hypothetical protein
MEQDDVNNFGTTELLMIIGCGLLFMHGVFGFIFITGVILHAEFIQKPSQTKSQPDNVLKAYVTQDIAWSS